MTTSRSARVLFLVWAIATAEGQTTRAQGLGYAIAGPAGYSGFFGSSASTVHVAGGSSPFVTGDYTYMGSGEGSFGAWNVGGGLDFWAKDRLGVRVEFRDHVRPDSRGAVQYWTIRAGVVFR